MRGASNQISPNLISPLPGDELEIEIKAVDAALLAVLSLLRPHEQAVMTPTTRPLASAIAASRQTRPSFHGSRPPRHNNFGTVPSICTWGRGFAANYCNPQPLLRPASLASLPPDVTRRRLSAGSGINGDSSSSGSGIVESAAATMQWKRDHYRKIEDKFQHQTKDDSGGKGERSDASETSSSEQKPEPLRIDKYEDVQPMWKEMESRVTRRRSLTLQQRDRKSVV